MISQLACWKSNNLWMYLDRNFKDDNSEGVFCSSFIYMERKLRNVSVFNLILPENWPHQYWLQKESTSPERNLVSWGFTASPKYTVKCYWMQLILNNRDWGSNARLSQCYGHIKTSANMMSGIKKWVNWKHLMWTEVVEAGATFPLPPGTLKEWSHTFGDLMCIVLFAGLTSFRLKALSSFNIWVTLPLKS